MSVPVTGWREHGTITRMAPVDVLLVSLGSTAGLRAADAELRDALERAGARVELVAAARQRDIRTLALTDLAWARAARSAASAGIAAHAPHAVLYSTTTAALLWPRPGAIRFDALAAQTRPGSPRRLAAPARAAPTRRGAAAGPVVRACAGRRPG